MYSMIYSPKGKYKGAANHCNVEKSKLMLWAALLISTTVGFGSSADAALVNVTFNGQFATGENLTGKIVYDAVGTSSTDEFVEFHDAIKSFTVTSSKFITTNGVDALNGISGFDNRIRYFSGSAGESPTSAGFNALQFSQSSDGQRGMFGEVPFIFIGFRAPARTFQTGQLPSAFDFTNSGDTPINFSYSYFDGSPYGLTQAGATITSITATPVATAVPEPATWAMVVGGFALIGGAMRVRRRRVVMAV